MATKICFLGGARYCRPLDETSAKKFRAMSSLGEIFVIGFSSDLRLTIFTEHARFYLLPRLWLPVLRYCELFLVGPILTFWLIVRHGIQVVVAQSPYEGLIAALTKTFAGWFGYHVRLVVESHGDFEECLFLQRKISFPQLYRFVMKLAAGYALKRADALRAISRATKEQLQNCARRKMIVQFPAWTDVETFLETEKAKNDMHEVLYVGVLTPLKGVHSLIKAFALTRAEFPNAQLSIIGKEQNKSYAADLRKQVLKLGLEEHVAFRNPMPQRELAMCMARASVLVLPSISEGLGRVLIEAMATGTPVIGSRIGGIPELVQDGVTGFLISPGDECAVAEKLRWMLTNPEKAREMGKRGRAFAERVFSTEDYLQGYRALFELAVPRIEQREHAGSPLQPSN